MRRSKPDEQRLRGEQHCESERAPARGGAVSQVGYVAASWGVTFVAGGLYAVALRLRGRRLLRRARGAYGDAPE